MKKILAFVFLCLFTKVTFAQILKSVITPQRLETENPEVTKFKKLSPKSEVWFYENANYTGKKYILGRGAYTLKTLGMDANDFFSSALIPRDLTVIVFEDDELKGNCYQLYPDYKSSTNLFQAYNGNFQKLEIWSGKNTLNQQLKGFKDINDKISSILIYDEALDFATLFEGRFFEGRQLRIYPMDIQNETYKNVNGNWGYPDLTLLGFNDKLSSLKSDGIVTGYLISQDANYKGLSKILENNIPNLKDGGYDTGTFPGIQNSDWNDRTSAIRLRFKAGKVTVEN